MLKAVEDISTTKKRLKIEIPSEAIETKIKNSLEKSPPESKDTRVQAGENTYEYYRETLWKER